MTKRDRQARKPAPKLAKPPKDELPKPLTLAEVLGTDNPAEQVARAQQLAMMAQTPVLTMVIQVDGRDPQGKVWVSNIGPPISGPVAHMMLSAAVREMAERQARADQAAAEKPPATGKPKG